MSVPRFTDLQALPLKRVMLARQPTFAFSPEDVEALVVETGLNKAQIQKWARNFRERWGDKSVDETLDFLRGVAKESITKVKRIFVTGFNLDPDRLYVYRFQKSNKKGVYEYDIKYMEAAFNKETGSFEMFIEFDEYVWEHKLVESLQSYGVCQVNTITFANNDGGDSAANALLRILSTQTTTGIKYSRGPCPPALLAKVQAKQQAAALAAASASREFDEKTMAAIKQSLEQQQEVMGKVEGNLQSQSVELNGIKNDMQSQVVKLDGIENGVCNVIPDYQNEIRTLREALVKKTAACDTIEGKLAHKTRIINQQDSYIATLELEKQLWSRTKMELQHKYSLMQEEFNMARTLGHMIETLSTILAEERAGKRQRA